METHAHHFQNTQISLMCYLKMNGLFSNTCDRVYQHRLRQFVDRMHIIDAFNGHNGAPLHLPLHVDRFSYFFVRFIPKFVDVPPSTTLFEVGLEIGRTVSTAEQSNLC